MKPQQQVLALNLGSATLKAAAYVWRQDRDPGVLIQRDDRFEITVSTGDGAMHGLIIKVMTGHLSEHVVGETDPSKRAHEAAALIELLQRYFK
ncbi:hypothetical protein [Thermomonas sp.]|uniref:hypothetical protein n=1 Tax=Thermomonas sp. TaxID=1971895 RepID=UPI002489BE55|nr:hypothetical protein [Thermomonas sp.]MDI1253307.1 hypothetical protein [Thermomonas sp.]